MIRGNGCVAGLDSVVGLTADGVCAIDADGRVLGCNPAAERILGQPETRLVGRRCWDVFLGRSGAGAPLCGPDCHVVTRVRRGEAVEHFQMVGTQTGVARLDVSTLVPPEMHPRRPAIVHVFREFTGEFGAAPGPGGPAAEAPGSNPAGWEREATLTRREAEILGLIAGGANTRAIAAALGISAATVRNHVQNLFGKLGVRSRLQAAVYATRNGHGGAGRPA